MNAQKISTIAVPAALLVMALVGGSILLLRLFFLSGLVIAVSYLWTRWSLRNLSVLTTKPPEHLQVGDTFQQEITISNSDKLPRFWLRVQNDTDLPGYHDTAIINIARQSSYSWQTNFGCRKRGRYHLGPVTVIATDPLGIFTSRCALGEAQEITVCPATIDLSLAKFASFSDFGYGSGYQSINLASPNASGVREFVSSDSSHHIHWRSTARMGKLMVKKFDTDHSYSTSKIAWILLDMNEKAHFRQGEETSDEYAITIAASVAKKYLQDGMRVGILASDERRCLITPQRGEEQLWGILEALALIRTDPKLKLSELVSHNLDGFHDNPLVIIVATSTSENLVEIIHQLRNRVDSVVVILLDVADFGGRLSSTGVSRTLTWSGAQVYTITKRAELSKALDNKIRQLPQLLV
ncbi:MAG: DUF58 domain-containing protein [Chloroflexi bacterium]|nr:DUF58 domain-containing protein [Chloroflexota bacterium]